MGNYLDYSLTFDFIVKVLVSLLCGGVLGIERQLQGKHPGLKTNMLICLGCMVFIHQAVAAVELSHMGDPTRVLGQIITGIGFLAAGAIYFKHDEQTKIGLTTSSVVWVNAAIGSGIGYGRISESVVITLVTVFVIPMVRYFEIRSKGGPAYAEESDS